MAPNKQGSKAQASRRQKRADKVAHDNDNVVKGAEGPDDPQVSQSTLSGTLVLAISVGIASIILGLIARGGAVGAGTGTPVRDAASINSVDGVSSSESIGGSPIARTDPPKPVVPAEIISSLATAATNADIGTAQSLSKTVLESANPWLMRKAADELYRNNERPFLDLSVTLLQRAYDLTFASSRSVSDLRRATYMLGYSLEKRGDSADAWALYNKAVEQKLWALPDQRPQHFFPSIGAGPPFPDPSDYAGAIEILESNFENIRQELIMHQRFPGQLTVDTEKLAVSGRWLQADFLFRGSWHEENVKRFPKTALVLNDIADRFAYKLPEAVMQMSTMVKGTQVRPHCGSGNHKVRLHLALYVTENCGIQIANETGQWTAGKVLVVDDSYVHSVWNNSTQPRTVLIVDVWVQGISEKEKENVRKYFQERDLRLSMSRQQQNQPQ